MSATQSDNKSFTFFGAVALISAILIAQQIIQSRIFSVTTWYHLSFLVISVAMFGMTLGALQIYREKEKYQRENYLPLMAKSCRMLAITIVIALYAQMLVPIIYSNLKGTLASLPIISLFTVLPYYYGGKAITLALTRAPYPTAKTYGIDLIGAAFGCLIALVLMSLIDAPSAVLLLAALSAIMSHKLDPEADSKQTKLYKRNTIIAIIITVIAVINIGIKPPIVYPHWVKQQFMERGSFIHDEWNSISRVTVQDEEKDVFPYLWGQSPITPPELKSSFYRLRMDGSAETPITRFDGNKESLSWLEYDVTTLAYHLPNMNSAAIIGIGGGRDALTAHYFGVKDIKALDINNVQISLLSVGGRFHEYTGMDKLPNIKLINQEARSWFTAQKQKFDIIQMSLIDTWASTGTGAFALSENSLYTSDAWEIFIHDLTPQGVFTVSRWHGTSQSEIRRLVSLATASLLKVGIENPQEHIYIAKGSRLSTLILSKSPFTAQQLDTLDKVAADKQYKNIFNPRGKMPDSMANILNAGSVESLNEYAKTQFFDISPPTDQRPFFFNQLRVNKPLEVLSLFTAKDASGLETLNNGQNYGVAYGHAKATMNLYFIITFAFLMVAFVILLPLRGAIKEISLPLTMFGSTWFLLIGLGFIFLEISLMQRMSIFLGHPVYGLSIILFSLILSTGLGSLLSDKLLLNKSYKIYIWALLTGGIISVMRLSIDGLLSNFAEDGIMTRAFICLALLMPIGVLVGYGFPTGIKLVERISTIPTPWFWGINGAAGVLGSAIAIGINIAYGIPKTLEIAAICYALLIIPAWGLGRITVSKASS